MPKNKVSDPIVDMLGNNEITNADVYDSLLTLKDTVQIISQIVKENSQDIKDIKRNISFPSKNTSNVHQESQTQSANVSENGFRPSLPPAKAEEVEPIISQSRLLGTGLFGPVYKGYYKGQPIALKVLRHPNKNESTEPLASTNMLNCNGHFRSFKRHEIMIMRSYQAKNILPLVTYCLDPLCLAYQFMQNGTLYTKLQDFSNPLNWKQKANMAVGIARGLRYLHANNVVHGDIKSSNIFLDEYLEPKIGEFGCSQLLYNEDSITIPNMPGTPYYLPNWYVQNQGGKVVRKQIDVYSYGVVLLEIMSEKLPGNQRTDSQHRTLRDFINTDSLNLSEPPEEYVSPADNENRRFKITIATEEDGEFHDSEADWAKIMFDIGRQCTIHDQTPWRAPFKDPEPWKTMEQNDITMERIHETLENCYEHYKNSLKLDETSV